MKILIVDDELPIREWLALSVQNAMPAATVLPPAADGREALEAIHTHEPELVFVDIKMPIMDGLTLLRSIKEYSPDIYVVMLTSYNDFGYAREALQAKADEYVLKAEITQDGLRKILQDYEAFVQQMSNAPQIYLRDVLEGSAQWPALVAPVHGAVFAVAYATQNASRKNISFEAHYNSFVQEVSLCPYDNHIMVLLCRCAQNISTGTAFQEAMSFCRGVASTRQVTVGFSGVTQQAQNACERALEALALSFYTSDAQEVLTYEEKIPAKDQALEALRKRAISALYQGRSEDVAHIVAEILFEAEKMRFLPLTILRGALADIVSAYKLSLLEFSNEQMEHLCVSTENTLQNCVKFTQLKQAMQHFLSQCGISLYVKKAVRSEHIKVALAYTIEHYASISSISEVATHVHLNTEYFCRLFKGETGETYNQYLTDLRIRKAVELLRHTDMRVYEVAHAVGYHNLSYFSRVFKKCTGNNPFAQKR